MDNARLERLLSSLHDSASSASVLHRLCVVGATADSVDGAGVSLVADGRHELLDASDASAERVESMQAEFGEGPCIEAVTTFRPFFEPDLASVRAQQRWPQFSRAACEQGVAAAFAFPLVSHGVAVGALDVYSARAGDLAPDDLRDVLVLADLAALAAHEGRSSPSIDGVEARAEAAEPWAHSAVVHNASGMVCEQLGIDVEASLLRIRAVAFATARTVAEVSRDIVARRLRLEPWVHDD
ncbi:MAG: hypothetical protein JWN39_3026 [Ilumatobacteraceae bacterium]|nr:hypothetical protein [Ilumatobacteraceae bacterium]